MSEPQPDTRAWGENFPLRRGCDLFCRGLAALGGLFIFAAALAVTGSVLSSNLGFGALRGEFELVELTCAVCASLFLPLCQFRRGHIMVDVFTTWLPGRVNRALDGLWLVIFAVVWAVLCERLLHGMAEMRSYGDRTMLLRVPIWWVYLPAILGTGASALIAALTAWGQRRARPITTETRT